MALLLPWPCAKDGLGRGTSRADYCCLDKHSDRRISPRDGPREARSDRPPSLGEQLRSSSRASHQAHRRYPPIYGTKFIQEAHDAQKLLRNQGYTVELVEDKRFPLWGPEGVESTKIKPFPAVLTPEQESKRPAVILHSSGSVSPRLPPMFPSSELSFVDRIP